MAKFRMDGGVIVNTEKASESWDEATYWDGRNHISKAPGSQWNHETLYRSRKGRYYVVSSSAYQGSRDSAEWVSNAEAARWLLLMGHDLPEELKEFVDEIEE